MQPEATRTDHISVRDLFIRLVVLKLHKATIISVYLTPLHVSIRFSDGTTFVELTTSY